MQSPTLAERGLGTAPDANGRVARDPGAIRLYEQDDKKTPEAAPNDFHQSVTNRPSGIVERNTNRLS